MTPTRRSAKNNNEADQNSASTNNGVPPCYLEPPPFYKTMVADFASRQRDMLLFKEEGPSSLLYEQKSPIRKYLPDGHITDSEKSWTSTHKQEEMDIKGEPYDAGEMKKEPLVASDQGSSQGFVILRKYILCCICINAPANMIWLPCRHLCVCSRCDNKSPTCPMCHTKKRSSFSV